MVRSPEATLQNPYNTKKMKIDFTKAKYQVPTEPKAIDLSHYETHLDVAEAGFTVRDGQRTRVKERNTKDTIYFSDDDRNNVIKLDAENMNNDLQLLAQKCESKAEQETVITGSATTKKPSLLQEPGMTTSQHDTAQLDISMLVQATTLCTLNRTW